jgi:hypothetical protein
VSFVFILRGLNENLPHFSMFTSSLSEEVKALEEDIAAVKDKVDDPVMCEKVKQFVYASKDIQDLYKADAGECLFCVYYLSVCQ